MTRHYFLGVKSIHMATQVSADFFTHFVAMMRMSGSIQKSTEVMKAMQGLIRIPEIQGAMMDLSREMSKVSRRGLPH